ncbi:hypothetical protein [Mycoplasma sp. HS2188]|uniref:hypothetical protein n=1 Tax=Mycoplasma sp. HS2188 TaxID=2976765 RepID=UPI0021AA9B3C|nr:hypothetical protein [Mycoplasma sp. HS2188]MCT4469585.1 hypothetical protein [Mycoplasma sp. HS2188]
MWFIIPGIIYIALFFSKIKRIELEIDEVIKEQKRIYETAVELQGGISENLESQIEA